MKNFKKIFKIVINLIPTNIQLRILIGIFIYSFIKHQKKANSQN